MSNNHNSKKIKIVTIVLVSILLIAGLIVASFLIYKYFIKDKNNQNNQIDQPTALVVETNESSVARAIQFNVGQADCGLVQVSKDNDFSTRDDNFNILVDVGVENGSSNQVKQNLIDKIYNSFVTNIDLIVISHLHFDHIGAIETLLNDNRFNFSKTVVLNNWAEAKYYGNMNKLTSTAKKMFNKMNDMKLSFQDSSYWAEQENNKIVNFGHNGYFSVLGGLDIKENNQNAWSVINRFEWKQHSILYTGDLAGKLNKNKIPLDISPKHYDQLDCDILKAPHHASTTENSNGIEFLQKVSPLEVWISVGHSDKYTLPDVSALKNYAAVLPNNDVALIKGTKYFGNKQSTNPEKWKALNNYISANPTINNNNQGYGDIKVEWKN